MQSDHPSRSLFRRPALVLLALLAFGASQTAAADPPAFPGAQGFGRNATGGRGGDVYYVTNLNDSGPGSFRDAVSQSNRTVVFAVSGVIDYRAPRYNVSPNVTIAGQTAPGDGVVLYGDGIGFTGSHNTITRFMRFRMGADGTSDRDTVAISRGNDMIFDHVSISWGRDETFSVNPDSGHEVNRITLQNAIVAQGLLGHSAGGLVQTDGGVSILNSLYHSNSTRNPRVRQVNEFVNNVVYNWGVAAYILGGSSGDSHANVFGNYFINGPSGGGAAFTRGNENFHLFAQDNRQDSNRNGSLDGSLIAQSDYGTVSWQDEPYRYPVSVADALPARTALKSVISKAGASLRRDEVDDRLLAELESWGELGQLISNEFEGPMNGPGVFRSGEPYADTSQDGMPDFWKQGTGQNIETMNNNDPSPSGSGYTRLEDYLNWLAEPHGIADQDTPVYVDLRQFTRGFLPFGPEYSVHDAENGTVALTDGHLALFEPDDGHEGTAGFAFTVVDADGDTLTRSMNLFFTPLARTGDVIWAGEDGANDWNTGDAPNWFDGRSLRFPFLAGDEVTFDDTGHAAVILTGSLEPSAVKVVAEQDYVFEGDGSLDGSTDLTKTGAGTLAIDTVNGYGGGTIVSEGALLVHGEITHSRVTAEGGAETGGSGRLGGGVSLASGAALVAGENIGTPGKTTVGDSLTTSGGATFHLDLSDNPGAEDKANDEIHVEGNLELGGTNTLHVNLLDGPPGDGTYTLFTYTGAFDGDVGDLELVGAHGELTNPPGAIELVVSSERPETDLVWAGGDENNTWDTGETPSWLNDGVPDYFYFLDTVLFDDTGSAAPPVELVGNLTPASVTVDADGDYTFEGDGGITGSTGLTKRGDGTLSLRVENDYTGPTIVEEGVLSVLELADAGEPSAVGAAGPEPENLVVSDATFESAGGVYETDRGFTLGGNAVFDITAGRGGEVVFHGDIAGSGTLVKRGPAPLVLTAENSFSGGTVIERDEIALFSPSGAGSTTANNHALGSGSVTFRGGTLRLYGGGIGDAGAGYGTFGNAIVVPRDESGTLITPGRYNMSASLTGSGTLNLEANYVRGRLSGNWSKFAGLINVTAAPQSPGNGEAEFRVNNSYGYANATIFLNDGVNITRQGGSSTIEIGALGGTSGARIEPGNQNSSGTSYVVGSNGEDATFAGRLRNDGNSVTFTKVGDGIWTLTGDNTYSGGTAIDGGTVLVENTSGSGLGSGSVSVGGDGILGGTGFVDAPVTASAGGAIAPGGDGIGTLSIGDGVTLNGGTLRIEIDPDSATHDILAVDSTLSLGGTLLVEISGPGTPASGDTFQILQANRFEGEFTALDLPKLRPGLEWDTGELSTHGTLSVTGEVEDPPESDDDRAEIEFDSETGSVAIRINNSHIDYTYQLQHNDTLEPDSWVDSGDPVAGNGGEIRFDDAANVPDHPRHFYRVVVTP